MGTPQYLSPEICRQQKYDYKSDIWSLGCVLYELCALQPAFPGRTLEFLSMFRFPDLQECISGKDFALLVHNIVRGIYKPIPSNYSVNLSEMVKVLLRPDPSRRPSADKVSQCHLS